MSSATPTSPDDHGIISQDTTKRPPRSVTDNKPSPKRVILRLDVDDFSEENSNEYNDAILAYLQFAGRLEAELIENRHYAHIEPFQDYLTIRGTVPKRFHITLDMEQDMVRNPEFDTIPHELYRVRRDANGKL
ncbi:hypothetical protein ACHAQA_006631 [Verticillium albo-atrum]